MQRLTGQRLLGPVTRRVRDERGASSVMIALLIVPIIGFAAISVDAAALWADRQRLQSAADAAALAVAQDCARNACGSPSSTAQAIAAANLTGATASLANSVTVSTGQVTVNTARTRSHLFAPLLGATQSSVEASATVEWGAPSGGQAMLPLTYSWCSFKAQTGGGRPSSTTQYVILNTKTDGTNCTGPSGNAVPGGFGWLDTDSGTCKATGAIGLKLSSSSGDAPSNGCAPSDFVDMQDKVVLLPIFDSAGGTGTNAWYQVYAYAAFKITGYYLAGQYSWNAPCSGNDRCIKGYFTELVDLTGGFQFSATAPNLGGSVVRLTK